ncbi:hypothetical protein AC249_AIPGENE587, partial [Exaiptasia diaphana]
REERVNKVLLSQFNHPRRAVSLPKQSSSGLRIEIFSACPQMLC